MRQQHAIVIGGGVIGVCAAYYLTRAGFRVTLLEKGNICAGSSYGNAGLVVPSHSIPLAAPGVWLKGLRWMLNSESPFYVKPRLSRDLFTWLWRFRRACTPEHVRRAVPVLRDLGHASLALFRELAALSGFEFGFRQAGVLLVLRTERGYEEAAREARLLGEMGVSAKVLAAPDARALEPSLGAGIVGGILFPDDAHLIPDAFVRGLAAVTERMGAHLRTDAEVLGFRTAGRRIVTVETTRGDVEAGEVILAAGSWSPGLSAALGLRLPIEPAKGYSVTYQRPAGAPRMPLLLGEAKVGVTPMGETLRLAGTLELGGLDLSINRRRVAAIVQAAARYVAGLGDAAMLEIWRGLRPCTPDGLPLLGRVRRFDNLIVATGHAMIGISLGPITGRIVTQLASGEAPSIDLEEVDPERFA